MKKNIKFLFGFVGTVLLSGCTSFDNYGPMPDDNLTDEVNMPYVAQSIKSYEERQKFKRPVTIRMSEKGHRFLSPDRRAASQFSLEMRKDMMASAEAKLVSIVSGLRDFEIVNNESSLRTAPGATITRAPAASAASGPYIFTFNISNVELKDAGDTIGTVADIASPFVDSKITGSAKKVHWYYADVTLEINLTAPDGKNVFSFSESVTHTKSIPTNTPDVSLLKDAVAYAVEQAMSRYAAQFGPPLHVDQMRGNGLFVRLSAGSAKDSGCVSSAMFSAKSPHCPDSRKNLLSANSFSGMELSANITLRLEKTMPGYSLRIMTIRKPVRSLSGLPQKSPENNRCRDGVPTVRHPV